MAVNGEKLEITEAYKIQEDEVEVGEAERDEKYFQMNLVWLRDNFNLNTRLPKIKEIGKDVYKNKATLGKAKAENRENKSERKKEQTVGATGDGFANDGRLIDIIVEWVKEHWGGVAIGVTFVIVVISLIIKYAGKN